MALTKEALSFPAESGAEHQRRRVDVKGYPVVVVGFHAADYLEETCRESRRMRMALHHILRLNPDDWGAQGYKVQVFAKQGLGL